MVETGELRPWEVVAHAHALTEPSRAGDDVDSEVGTKRDHPVEVEGGGKRAPHGDGDDRHDDEVASDAPNPLGGVGRHIRGLC